MRRSREILTFAFLWRLVVSGGGAGAVPLPLPVPVLVPAAGLVLVPALVVTAAAAALVLLRRTSVARLAAQKINYEFKFKVRFGNEGYGLRKLNVSF